MQNLEQKDLSAEAYREYDFQGRIYKIENPAILFTRPGGTTHRVMDVFNVVHCVPAPGVDGCVLRWKSKPTEPPCTF